MEEVSPTGQPVIPTAVGPIVAALGAVALAVVQLAPEHTIAHKVAFFVVGLCGVFGPASAGWRK